MQYLAYEAGNTADKLLPRAEDGVSDLKNRTTSYSLALFVCNKRVVCSAKCESK